MAEPTLLQCVQELEGSLNDETVIYEKLEEIAREIRLAVERHDDDALGVLLERKKGIIAELKPIAETTVRL